MSFWRSRCRNNRPSNISLLRRACQIRHCRRRGDRSQRHNVVRGILSLKLPPQQAIESFSRITGSNASIVELIPENLSPIEGAMIIASLVGSESNRIRTDGSVIHTTLTRATIKGRRELKEARLIGSKPPSEDHPRNHPCENLAIPIHRNSSAFDAPKARSEPLSRRSKGTGRE